MREREEEDEEEEDEEEECYTKRDSKFEENT